MKTFKENIANFKFIIKALKYLISYSPFTRFHKNNFIDTGSQDMLVHEFAHGVQLIAARTAGLHVETAGKLAAHEKSGKVGQHEQHRVLC